MHRWNKKIHGIAGLAGNKPWRRCIAVIAALLCLGMYSGCLYKGVRVTGLESHAKVMEGKTYHILGEAEGTSSSFNLLWILPVTPRIDYDRAVNEAINSLRGDNLINVRAWFERQVWIIGMVEILHVKGTVIQYER
ncbi:MAG TPA: hypothetical protein PKN50_03085 [Spirochaetota bacterium]|jgi:hypothetical protein|nr:hypothetical protein [Spirochaetota bacterium]HPV41718.1 hypothetical protein [Spirochaetota bacterium]